LPCAEKEFRVQTTITPESRPSSTRGFKPQGVYVHVIQGRYRPLTVQQIALAWWLYREGHLTARQFRIYFAAHEMHERRRYTKLGNDRRPRTPTYGPEEVQALIGSRAAEREILADIRVLSRVGLVKIKIDSIEFAVSVDQIAVEDVSGFWAFFDELPNRARRVPVPRRTLRALAKGLSRGTAAMVLALMIRSLYWHQDGRESREIARNDDSGGRYRIDGRTKCAWIAEVFGVDRKTISTARGQLIERGWLRPIECQQWELNKWGQRYTIDVDAFGPAREQGTVGRQEEETQQEEALLWAAEMAGDQAATVGRGSEHEEEGGEPGGTSGNFPSPARDFTGTSPSPCLNSSSSSTKKDLITRKPAPATRSGPTRGNRKKGVEVVGGREAAEPVLRDVVRADLEDDERLEELYQQALQAGHPVRGEKGRLEFYALAERARAHGKEAPRLFAWLLKENRFDYITQADEDRALARIKAGVRAAASRHREQAQEKQQGGRKEKRGQGAGTYDAFVAGLGEDERFVHACILTGRQRKLDPLRIALAAGWTKQKWETARESYELVDRQRWTQAAREVGSLYLKS
jgi:hypothetical protein